MLFNGLWGFFFLFYVVLSIAERKRVKSPAMIEEWSVYLFSCISFYFIYFEDLLGVCTFVIGAFSWCMNFDKNFDYELTFLSHWEVLSGLEVSFFVGVVSHYSCYIHTFLPIYFPPVCVPVLKMCFL